MTTTRWRLYVTMETLWQQQDGGYALLWKRYPNIQITSNFAVEDVYTELVIDVFYIFNSTVIDWTVEDVYTELVIDVFYIFNSTVIDWTCYPSLCIKKGTVVDVHSHPILKLGSGWRGLSLTPRPFYPRRKSPLFLLNRILGGPQRRLGRFRKNVSFPAWTREPLA